MTEEYSRHLQNAASFSQEFGETFAKIQFDGHSQAVEVFVLQALSMCSSHCHAAAVLLQNQFKGEAVSVLRSVQELLFDLHWILQAEERTESLERAYRLEADPYAHWASETRRIEQASSSDIGRRMREAVDDIATHYPFLTHTNSDGTKTFKTAPSFAKRMGPVRPQFYHIYCFSSLFSHPTPTVKRLYLKTSDSDGTDVLAIDESIRQFVAYTLLFVQMIMRYAEAAIGSFATSTREKRNTLYTLVVDLVKTANKGYFRNPDGDSSTANCPA